MWNNIRVPSLWFDSQLEPHSNNSFCLFPAPHRTLLSRHDSSACVIVCVICLSLCLSFYDWNNILFLFMLPFFPTLTHSYYSKPKPEAKSLSPAKRNLMQTLCFAAQILVLIHPIVSKTVSHLTVGELLSVDCSTES